MGGQQQAVLFLPFVAVGLHGTVFEMGLEVGGFVQENPEEEVGVEVAVDRNLVEGMPRLGPTVVAQLGAPLTGDVEMHTVLVEIGIDPIHRLDGEVVGEDAAILFLGRQNEGQSQWLRLCLCILTLLPHEVQSRQAARSSVAKGSSLFIFMPPKTRNGNFYCMPILRKSC